MRVTTTLLSLSLFLLLLLSNQPLARLEARPTGILSSTASCEAPTVVVVAVEEEEKKLPPPYFSAPPSSKRSIYDTSSLEFMISRAHRMVDGEIGHDIALSPHVSGALELVRIIEYVVNKNIQNKMQLLTVTEERKQRKILQAAKRLRKKVQKFLNNVAASLDDVGGATGGAEGCPA